MVKVDIFLQGMSCRHGFPPYYYESLSESATTKKLHNLKQPHGLLRVNKPMPLLPLTCRKFIITGTSSKPLKTEEATSHAYML